MPDPSGDPDPGEIAAQYVDGEGAGSRQHVNIAADRPIIARAGQLDGIAPPTSRDQTDHVRKAHPETGPRCGHAHDWTVKGARHSHAHRAVLVRIALSVKHDASAFGDIRPATAVQAELRCDDIGTGNLQYPVGAVADACIDEHLPAEKILKAGAEQPRRARLDGANQSVAASQRCLQINIGDDIEQAD